MNEVLPLNKKTAHQGREPFNEDNYVVVQEFMDNRRDDGFAVKIAHLSLLYCMKLAFHQRSCLIRKVD